MDNIPRIGTPDNETEVTMLRRHIEWAGGAYKLLQAELRERESVIEKMLDALPYEFLVDYMEDRAEREEDEA